MLTEGMFPTSRPVMEPKRLPTSPPRRILVAEDNDDIRRLNREGLVLSGYEVDAAEDGAAAWQSLSTGRYDLLVTDNNMPKLSGVELLVKLRAARMVLPVIMATGNVPKHAAARLPSLHPVIILLKPYAIAELVEAVAALLVTIGSVCKPVAPTGNRQPSAPGWNLSL